MSEAARDLAAEPRAGGPGSLRRATAARLVAESLGIFLSLVAGVLTARFLGPANKGNLSSLLFVAVLFTHAGGFGLGDAAIILLGRGAVTFGRAVRGTMLATTATAAVASVVAVGVAWLEFGEQSVLRNSMLAAGAVVFVGVLAAIMTALVNAQERIVLTSAVLALNLAVNAVLTWYFVRVLDLAVLGGVTAAFAGNAVAVLVFLVVLRRELLPPRLDLQPGYLALAFRTGLPIQAAFILIALTQRLDQILVLSLGGDTEAGLYSISLTLGVLVTYPAVALTVATFPRLASLTPSEAVLLVRRAVRMASLTAVVGAVVLGALTPFAVPTLFGENYRDAIGPSLILVAAGLPNALQWVLARSLSARGRPAALYLSYSVCLATMVTLDLLVVPRYGPSGAASVSLAVGLIGMTICLVLARREWDIRPAHMVPTLDDLRSLATMVPGRGGR